MKPLDKSRFGPAGYPTASGGKLEKVFSILTELGLDALEYAAVHGLRTSREKAERIGQLSQEHDIVMSMHAAYYISLASKSKATRDRSKERLIKALQFAPVMNVKRIVFHPGTRGDLEHEKSYCVVRDALSEVWERAGSPRNGVYLSPEIAGKLKPFGSREEIIRLCSDLGFCIPTIDWAHVYARSQGEVNNRDAYLKLISECENALGDRFVDNMHFHISGITYTQAGEKSHRSLGGQWGPDIFPLMAIVHEMGYKPVIISETPDPVKGALYAKYILQQLEGKEK